MPYGHPAVLALVEMARHEAEEAVKRGEFFTAEFTEMCQWDQRRYTKAPGDYYILKQCLGRGVDEWLAYSRDFSRVCVVSGTRNQLSTSDIRPYGMLEIEVAGRFLESVHGQWLA